MKNLINNLVFGAFALVMVNAHADPIGGSSPCGSCFGSEITLDYSIVSSTNLLITLTIDTSSYTGPLTDWISAVAIKPASQVAAASLSSTTAPGTWTFMLGGLANGNCTGSGSGFMCAEDGTSAVTDGSSYQWVFDVTVASANKWLLDTLGASVKVNYDNTTNCENGCLTSEGITLQPGGPPLEVPEPQTLALVGLGLLGMAVARRRRNG